MEPQQCWHLLALVAYSLKPVKVLGPCKRTQHCWPTTPNNVGSCWHLLRPFAWALLAAISNYQPCRVILKNLNPPKYFQRESLSELSSDMAK